VLQLFAELCDFGAQLFVTLTDFPDLLLETGITVGRPAFTALFVMALHLLGTGADAAGFVVESGLLEVHGGGHEVGEGGFRSGLGAGVMRAIFVTARATFVPSTFVPSVFTPGTFVPHLAAGLFSLRAAGTGRGGTITVARGSGGFGLAGFSSLIGTTFRATFAGRTGFFTGFGCFGAGFVLLGATGEGGQAEGGGDGGTEKGA